MTVTRSPSGDLIKNINIFAIVSSKTFLRAVRVKAFNEKKLSEKAVTFIISQYGNSFYC